MEEMPCAQCGEKVNDCACENVKGFAAADAFAAKNGGLCANLAAALRKLADERGVFLSANAVDFICYLQEQAGDDCRKRQRAALVAALEEVFYPLASLSNSVMQSIEASPDVIHWLEYGDFRVGIRGNSQKSLNLHGNFFGKVLDFTVREIFGPVNAPSSGAAEQDKKSA